MDNDLLEKARERNEKTQLLLEIQKRNKKDQEALYGKRIAGGFYNEELGGDFAELKAHAQDLSEKGETEGYYRGWIFNVEEVLAAKIWDDLNVS